jgi:lycopene cyclase domain-containing protein
MKFTYLIIDVASFIVPFIFSFHPKINFHKEYKYFWPANFIVATVFILWDFLFTGLNVWAFNPEYVSGIYFFNLPLEEVLFFIFIPYSCVFTYHCFKTLFEGKAVLPAEKFVSMLLIGALFVTGILNIGKIYTSVTFISLSVLIFALQFILKVKWLGYFYFTYLILLIPFLIVNGILTGSFLEEPVVSYNNNENLGVRIFTIPVEDVFYGMLLVIFNVTIFERLKNNSINISNVNK